MGHAYMIPFENKRRGVTEVQVVVGYKGLIDLARRSGHITSLSANIHYSDDDLWEYEEGTEARLRHRPGKLEGDKLHAYAIAKFKDGGPAYVVLPWAHIMKIRDGSQGWQTAKRYGKPTESQWGKYEDEMAKKTAVRTLAKYLPLSLEFMDAVQIDDTRADYRAQSQTIDAPAEPAHQESRAAPAQWQGISGRIASDLLYGAKPQDLTSDFAPQITSMKIEAPGIYQNLRAEIEGYPCYARW